MKKNLWMLGMAVAALTSCTQSEVVEMPESKVIQFDSFVNRETRETISSTDDLDHLFVYGYNTLLEDDKDYEEATYTQLFNESQLNSPAWTHQNPNEEAAWANKRLYRFAAYTNGNQKCPEGVVSFDPQKQILTFTNYEVTDKDLIADVTDDKFSDDDVSSESKVGLNFNHMLARIRFTFTNKSTTNKIEIHEIVINNVLNKSTGTIDENGVINWESTGTKVNKTFEHKILDVSTSCQLEHYVIPQSNEFTVIIKYCTLAADGSTLHTNGPTNNGEEVSLAYANALGQKIWEPGYVYNYSAELNSSQKKIEFFVETFSAWENKNPGLDI